MSKIYVVFGVVASLSLSLLAWAQPKSLTFDADAVRKHIALTPIEKKFGVDEVQGLRWRDNNGDNFFAFHHITHQDPSLASLRMHFYAKPAKGKKYRRLRLLRDDSRPSTDPCYEFDMHLKDGTLQLTDLDEDGVAEVSFGYYASDDGSGRRGENEVCGLQRYKYVVLEGKDKYILRGTVRHAKLRRGGTFRAAPAEGKWPRKFLDHARAGWKKTATLPRGFTE